MGDDMVSVIALALLQLQTTSNWHHITRSQCKLEACGKIREWNATDRGESSDEASEARGWASQGPPWLQLDTQVLQAYTHLMVIKTSELIREMVGNNRSQKYVRAGHVQTRLVLCMCICDINEYASYGMQFAALDWNFECPMWVLWHFEISMLS